MFVCVYICVYMCVCVCVHAYLCLCGVCVYARLLTIIPMDENNSNIYCKLLRMPDVWYNVVHIFLLLLVEKLRKLSVQSSFDLKMTKSLLVNSCNLELGKTIGQGT